MSFHTNYNVLRRFRHVILSVAAGVILALAMPTPGLWVLAWVGLVPLFVALHGASVPRAALCGLLTGIVYYAIILRWLLLFGTLPWLVLVAYQALYIAIFAALYARLNQQRIGWPGLAAAPAAWVGLQFVRTLGPYGFIWGSLAHTQANLLPVVQIASFTGPWGIDFVVCFVSLALSIAIIDRKRSPKPLIVAASLVLGMLAFGVISLHAPMSEVRGRRVAVLQGNMNNDFHPIPHFLRHARDRYARMTVQAAKTGPEIILWPETALPMDITTPGMGDYLSNLAKLSHSCLLIGGYDPSYSGEGSYNSLFSYGKDGNMMGCYHKVQLVPFGEFVPLREQLPFMKNYGIRPEDVLGSDNHALLDSPIGKVGVSICFESTFPQIARTETRDGAQVLCVVSNDAWLKHTPATQQHLMMARLRAVENRRFLLRAASTGISAVIDPYGRIRREAGLFREDAIIDSVVPSRHLSLYTHLGDWLAYLCIAMTAACLLAPTRASKKASSGKRRRGTAR
jgi:apolipoprotein N-acyltransferase